MSKVQCFDPIGDAQSRVLILGSMPGAESLKAGQYYANPRNAFWPIMGELFGIGFDLQYERRLAVLMSKGVALWDSLKTCIRPDSLDASITQAEVNDFSAFFVEHPQITHVFFNGAKSEQTFKRLVTASSATRRLVFTRLPSTSPAHAAMPFAAKVKAWSAVTAALAPT
jgi:double-stranded uracil-DNA glycosylase